MEKRHPRTAALWPYDVSTGGGSRVSSETRRAAPVAVTTRGAYTPTALRPSEEKQVGHSERIMRPLMLALGATLLVGVPALIALGPVPLPAVQSAGSATGGALC